MGLQETMRALADPTRRSILQLLKMVIYPLEIFQIIFQSPARRCPGIWPFCERPDWCGTSAWGSISTMN